VPFYDGSAIATAGNVVMCSHLVAPGSKGLFHRAISESGYCSGYLGTTRDDAYANGEALARVLGCMDSSKVLECLRLGSFHAAEFSYVFGFDTPPGDDATRRKAAGRADAWLLDSIRDERRSERRRRPEWLKYDATGDQNMGLDVPTSAGEAGYKKAKCDFWDSVYH
jgi:carboxylesterase type B